MSKKEVAGRPASHPIVKRMLSKETGIALAVMDTVKRRHPGDPLRQVSEFFDRFRIPAATGRKREASFKTEKNYRDRLQGVVKTLRAMNMPIQNLDEITLRQVRKLFLHLEQEGWSIGWLRNVNTTVRRFGIWIDKPDLCPQIKHLVEHPEPNHRIAADPKAWESHVDDISMIIAKVELISEVTGMQLRLADSFGGRVQEFLMFSPKDCIKDGYIHIKHGTKGGRPRYVPIETVDQRHLLGTALTLANRNGKGLLIAKPGNTLAQSINHFYSVLRKAGISRKRAGITAHGLRHGYACRTYLLLTGEPPPIMGGGYVDPECDRSARKEIAERLGHSRVDITDAYLGSHRSVRRALQENIRWLTQKLESDRNLRSLIQHADLAQLILVGAAATGQRLSKDKGLTLAYRCSMVDGLTQKQADLSAMKIMLDLAEHVGSVLSVFTTTVPMSMVPPETPMIDLSHLTRILPSIDLQIAVIGSCPTTE